MKEGCCYYPQMEFSFDFELTYIDPRLFVVTPFEKIKYYLELLRYKIIKIFRRDIT